MTPRELIKKIHSTYSQSRGYKDKAACSLTIALPEIREIDELTTKVGLLQHEYKAGKIFDMRWEWLPGDCDELSYEPGTFSASLDAEEEEAFDITATQNLKANLLHGILSMETEEDIFLIKRLIFFGEAEFWLEEFYQWDLSQIEGDGRSLWHLKRIVSNLGDSEIDMFVDPEKYTLTGYESNARRLFESCLSGSTEERKESHDMLFGDEPGPVSVVQKYAFKEIQLLS